MNRPDVLLPVIVENLPSGLVFQPDGRMRDKVSRARDMGVVRIIAGPERCHVIVDVKRPYFKGMV